MAQPILHRPASPLWPLIGSIYFQLHCRHCGEDPRHFLPDSRSPPLLRQLHYCRPHPVSQVCTEFGYCFGSPSTAWSTIASWQVYVGPSTVLTDLGIESDFVNQMACLPQDKLLSLQNLIGSCLPWKWCNRHKLESPIAHLHHAAKVVWPGRMFLHCMIDLLCCFRRRNHPICLNWEFHLVLLWWYQFLAYWHSISFWLFPGLLPEANVEVSSNAAGSISYGAYMKGHWFAGSWAQSQQLQSIA